MANETIRHEALESIRATTGAIRHKALTVFHESNGNESPEQQEWLQVLERIRASTESIWHKAFSLLDPDGEMAPEPASELLASGSDAQGWALSAEVAPMFPSEALRKKAPGSAQAGA